MDIPFAAITALGDVTVRTVFSKLVKDKALRFKDLVAELEPSNVSVDEVSSALGKLTRANLIKEKPSIVTDLNSYVITAAGLNAARKVDTR